MRVLVAMLIVTVFAGCSEAPSDEEQFEEAIETGVAADLPPWEVGMWWEYETSNGISKFIVTSETGTDYILDTNDQQVAYFDAMYDISFLGEIRKSDLAGSQGNQRIVMFDWPLTENKEWQTTWDEDTLHMVANAMGENQFHVMGHNSAGDMAVEYHYNADVAWFEYIVFYNTTSGDEQFRLDLQSNGFDFAGPYYRYTIGETMAFFAGAQESGLRDVKIDEEWNELYIVGLIACGGDTVGESLIGFNSPSQREASPLPMLPAFNEPTFGMNHDCMKGTHALRNVTVDSEPGDWELGFIGGHPNAALHLWVEPRTLEIINV